MTRYTVQGVLSTLNDHDGANRSNKFLGAQMKRENTDLVAIQVKGKKKITKPCIISFEWFISSRADFDNVRFGVKYILDGMVKAGILPDDNQKWVLGFGGDAFIKVEKGKEKVVILVDEMEE